MPGFAFDLGLGRPDFTYSVLLAADAAGGLTAGLVLESRGLLPPKVRNGICLGDDVVLRPGRFCSIEHLCRGNQPVVRRRIRRTRVQFDGAILGAVECAG